MPKIFWQAYYAIRHWRVFFGGAPKHNGSGAAPETRSPGIGGAGVIITALVF